MSNADLIQLYKPPALSTGISINHRETQTGQKQWHLHNNKWLDTAHCQNTFSKTLHTAHSPEDSMTEHFCQRKHPCHRLCHARNKPERGCDESFVLDMSTVIYL